MLQYSTLIIYTWAKMFAQLSVKKVIFKHKVENVGFLSKKWSKTLKTAISRANLRTVALCGTIGIKSVSYTDLKFSKHLSDVTSVLVYNEFVKNAS